MSQQTLDWLSERAKLDRDSSIPFYQQLKDILLESIREDALQPGDRLPSERELGERLGVSRLTVRRALNDLINAGWLFTQPGKGTYVRDAKLEQGIQQLVGLSEDMKRRGYAVTSQVLQVTVLPASGKTAKTMKLAPQEEVVLLERLRSVDGQPLSIERSYLNHKLCPGIAQHDLTTSLYRILRENYGLNIPKAEQTYEAVTAGRRESQLLGIPEGAPLLLSERVAYTDTGGVIEYGVAWYRGDRYKFHAVLLGTEPGPDILASYLASSR